MLLAENRAATTCSVLDAALVLGNAAAQSLTSHGDDGRLRLGSDAAQGVENLFYKSLKVLLTAVRHRLILPPHTTDKRPPNSNARGTEAANRFQLDGLERQLFLLTRAVVRQEVIPQTNTQGSTWSGRLATKFRPQQEV
jgi:hypothetical protein